MWNGKFVLTVNPIKTSRTRAKTWLILLGKQFRSVTQPRDERGTESRRSADNLASLQTSSHSVSQATTFTSSLTERFDVRLTGLSFFACQGNKGAKGPSGHKGIRGAAVSVVKAQGAETFIEFYPASGRTLSTAQNRHLLRSPTIAQVALTTWSNGCSCVSPGWQRQSRDEWWSRTERISGTCPPSWPWFCQKAASVFTARVRMMTMIITINDNIRAASPSGQCDISFQPVSQLFQGGQGIRGTTGRPGPPGEPVSTPTRAALQPGLKFFSELTDAISAVRRGLLGRMAPRE